MREQRSRYILTVSLYGGTTRTEHFDSYPEARQNMGRLIALACRQSGGFDPVGGVYPGDVTHLNITEFRIGPNKLTDNWNLWRAFSDKVALDKGES
jgi:hypothetical protein